MPRITCRSSTLIRFSGDSKSRFELRHKTLHCYTSRTQEFMGRQYSFNLLSALPSLYGRFLPFFIL